MRTYPQLNPDRFGAGGASSSTWYIFCNNPEDVLYRFVATCVLKKIIEHQNYVNINACVYRESPQYRVEYNSKVQSFISCKQQPYIST